MKSNVRGRAELNILETIDETEFLRLRGASGLDSGVNSWAHGIQYGAERRNQQQQLWGSGLTVSPSAFSPEAFGLHLRGMRVVAQGSSGFSYEASGF